MKVLKIALLIIPAILLAVGCGKDNSARKNNAQSESIDPAYYCLDSLKAVDGRLVMSSDDTALARQITDKTADMANTPFEKTLVKIGRGEYDAAETTLTDALNKSPENSTETAELYFYLGIAWYLKNDTLKALEAFDSSLVYDNNAPRVLTSRGITQYDLGRYKDAIEDYNSAITIRFDCHEAWYHKANTYYILGNFKDAIATYENAIIHKPDMIKARYNLAATLHRLGRLEEAMTGFDSVIAYKHDDYHAWSGRGLIFSRWEKYEEAIVCFDSSLFYKRDNSLAWNNKAAALAVLKRYDEATKCIDSSFIYDPNNPQTVQLQNLILRESGKALE
jgi:tetratricopeptide (TPR) repeat protein